MVSRISSYECYPNKAHRSFKGYNHSGKFGIINFLNGVMGVANAQRTLNYIRIITEFISQPEYQNVVPMFGIINEAVVKTIGTDQINALCVFLSWFSSNG